MHRLFRRHECEDRGAVLILGALFASVAIVAAALSIDIGHLVLEKRSNQRVADLAALDAVRGLQAASGRRLAVEQLAVDSAKRNGFDVSSATRSCPPNADGATYAVGGQWLKVEIGKVTTDSVTGDTIFTPQKCVLDLVSEVVDVFTVDGVRVTASSPVPFDFMPGASRETASAVSQLPTIATPQTTTWTNTTTTTTVTGVAGIWVGSQVVSIDTAQAQILNSVLEQALDPNQVTPPTVNGDAAGYTGLATAHVAIGDLANALGLTTTSTADLTAADVNQILASQITFPDLLQATVDVLNRSGDPAAAADATFLGQQVTPTIPGNYATVSQPITLGDLVDGSVNTLTGSYVAGATLTVLDILRGGALLADGDHLVSTPLPPTVAIPGVTTATVTVSVIEAAQHGGPGPEVTTKADTAQIRTSMLLTMPVTVAGLTDPIMVKVPVDIQGGRATATIAHIDCPNVASVTPYPPNFVKVDTVTNALTAQVGNVTGSTANGLVTISAAPGTPVSSTPTSSALQWSDPTWDTVQQTAASQLPALSLSSSDVTVTAAGLVGVSSSTIAAAVASAVTNVLGSLPGTAVPPLYNGLGVAYATADVWLDSVAGGTGWNDPVCAPVTTTSTVTGTTTTVTQTYGVLPVLVK